MISIRGCRLQQVIANLNQADKNAPPMADYAFKARPPLDSQPVWLHSLRKWSWEYGYLPWQIEADFRAQSSHLWGEPHLWAMLTQRTLEGLQPPSVSLGWLEKKEIQRLYQWKKLPSKADPFQRALQSAILDDCDLLTIGCKPEKIWIQPGSFKDFSPENLLAPPLN
jgi:hypothetical protein